MRENIFYHLAAIKNYFLAHEYHNSELKYYIKNIYFNNIFNIYEKINAYDDHNKILVDDKLFLKISNHISPLIKTYTQEAKLYPKGLSPDAFAINYVDNESIISKYTKNYTVNNTIKGLDNIKKKSEIYRKHIVNLKHIHSFNLILSIDFEYNERSVNGVSEIGISIYQPRLNIFKYEHIIISGKECAFGKKALLQKMFNFGITKVMDSDEAFSHLYKLIDKADILLAHDIINELKILSIKPNWNNIIDTKICELIINPQERYLSLGDALQKYEIPSSSLHNAGNDAAYSLHLALKMHNLIKQ